MAVRTSLCMFPKLFKLNVLRRGRTHHHQIYLITYMLCLVSLLQCFCFASSRSVPGYTVIDEAMHTNIHVHSIREDQLEPNILSSRQKRQGVTTTPQSMIIDEDQGHLYYNSSYYQGQSTHYIDLEREPSFTVIPHKALSESHLTAAVVNLPFVFPFYGHNVTKAYIATGGFIYLGTFFHEYISANQYVAPLMGNFDPSINDSAIIRYANNGTAFTVEWSGVHVQHNIEVGSFTFQATLLNDGRIVFAYKRVPVSPLAIHGGNGHKVTVGVSDAYYVDKYLEGSSVIQRYIYRYHVIELDEQLVEDNTAFVLTPLKTCNQLSQSCKTCLGSPLPTFQCGWCNTLSVCSSGFDRNRQDWTDSGCNNEKHSDVSDCSSGVSAGGVIGILIGILVLIAIIALVLWLGYSYTHPTSNSGLFLIEFRHFFKKDSRHNMSNEDRHAVSISGDIHDNVEANGSSEKSGDVSLHVCDTPTATLSATAAANNYPEDPDVKPISADAPSVVQA
ncbi:plexin domain-containing protein 2-like [Asterias amurensis]|uniref:plexin domain-containing protein 2-like n=1 Tax=Asterias amurensis TaxID=7602 RepID=UPI003AB41C26